jgi:hypothetical protein
LRPCSFERERHHRAWFQWTTRFDFEKLQCYFRCGRDNLIAGLAFDCEPRHIVARSKKDALGKLLNFDCYVCRCHRYPHLRVSHLSVPTQLASCGASYIDDEAQAERGERSFHMFHPRGVAQVEHAIDLREVPA